MHGNPRAERSRYTCTCATQCTMMYYLTLIDHDYTFKTISVHTLILFDSTYVESPLVVEVHSQSFPLLSLMGQTLWNSVKWGMMAVVVTVFSVAITDLESSSNSPGNLCFSPPFPIHSRESLKVRPVLALCTVFDIGLSLSLPLSLSLSLSLSPSLPLSLSPSLPLSLSPSLPDVMWLL